MYPYRSERLECRDPSEKPLTDNVLTDVIRLRTSPSYFEVCQSIINSAINHQLFLPSIIIVVNSATTSKQQLNRSSYAAFVSQQSWLPFIFLADIGLSISIAVSFDSPKLNSLLPYPPQRSFPVLMVVEQE